MNWDQTVAYRCRYGDVASSAFPNAEIIWERSEDSYQGFADVLGKLPDGKYFHYEWSYGSCSGCDEWEGRGLSDEEVIKEMQDGAAYFNTTEHLLRYLHLDEETIKDAKYPSANTTTNGSLPGMLHILSGGCIQYFEEMAQAFKAWLEQNAEKGE